MAIVERSRASGSVWNNPTARSIAWQMLTILAVVGVAGYFVHNSLVNLQRQSIATGFSFLDREAGFDIGESLIPFGPTNTYARAFLVGFLNTCEVAVLGIIFSTILGTLLGIARLSPNWLLSRLALLYVEIIRNIPLLLQLLLIYSVLNVAAPPPRGAWTLLPGVFLSNRGLVIPFPSSEGSNVAIFLGLLVGIAAAIGLGIWGRRRQAATGRHFPVFWVSLLLVLGVPVLTWLATGASVQLSVPVLQGFNFTGGASLSPELTALLSGLVLYTSSYICEIVRGGILAVSHGQTEAAAALGLKRSQILRLIILPQALRIIIPPLTSQYLNLTKNSTLAVAIGFPDLVFVANTQMNQTGQAIEGMVIVMGTYLAISVTISIAMNIYNARIALKRR